MTREEVYKLIDGEREYQDSLPQHSIETDQLTPVAAWILYMDVLLARAKNAVYNLDSQTAKEMVRKTTAVGVACMEYNETKPRVVDDADWVPETS